MLYRLAADIVVVLHFSFIVFVITGGFLAIRWPRIAWCHLPVVAYGAIIEFFSFVCFLTPLEQWLRVKSGSQGYDTSFTENYILPLVYPKVLTYRLQVILGISVIVINLIAYSLVLRRRRMKSRQSGVVS
jgi:hypothetical protein